MKRWTIYLLALIGLLTLVYQGVRLLPHAPDDAFVAPELRSPDGRYKAVLVSQNGGGAMAPYCVDTVVVLPAKAKVDVRDDAQVVFVGGCETFVDPGTRVRRNGPDIHWSKPGRLDIHFSQQALIGVAEMRLKRHAVGGDVDIAYRMDGLSSH